MAYVRFFKNGVNVILVVAIIGLVFGGFLALYTKHHKLQRRYAELEILICVAKLEVLYAKKPYLRYYRKSLYPCEALAVLDS